MSRLRDEPEDAYAAVRCHGDSVPGYCCGKVSLTEQQYIAQMERPDSLWCCPNCGSTATFDDAEFERIQGIDQDPTPWCSGCGAMKKAQCDCGPIAENE
jgi:hypothetical protein